MYICPGGLSFPHLAFNNINPAQHTLSFFFCPVGAVLLYHTTPNVVQILASVLLGNGIGFHGQPPHISIRNRNSPTTSLRGILLSTIAMRCFAKSANPFERLWRTRMNGRFSHPGFSCCFSHDGRMGQPTHSFVIPPSPQHYPHGIATSRDTKFLHKGILPTCGSCRSRSLSTC